MSINNINGIYDAGIFICRVGVTRVPAMKTITTRYKENRLQQLRGFCYAAEFGSISRAAERLLLRQPSVSMQIQALEREFKAALFERRGPKIALTPAGRILYELASPLVEGLDSLRESFDARRDGLLLSPRARAGTVAVELPSLSLGEGVYQIGVALADEKGLPEYDWHDRAYRIRVAGDGTTDGPVHEQRVWEVVSAEEPARLPSQHAVLAGVSAGHGL